MKLGRIGFVTIGVVFVIFARLSCAQTQNAPATPPASASVAAPVAGKDIVLTVHGVCGLSPNPLADDAGDCTAVVGRERFEELLKVVSPAAQANPAAKRSLASQYSDLLALEDAAKKAGIDHSQQFLQTMEWLRLSTLAELYRRNLQQESSTSTEQEIREYYQKHVTQYEEVKLRRMVAPRNNLSGGQKEARQLASEFWERAAKGENMDELQQKLYTALGFQNSPPATEVGMRRRASLPPEVSDRVFALQPGQVSEVETEPFSFVIYKVEEKHVLPLERVREEIRREIEKKKMDAVLKSVLDGIRADLNENYFGAANPSQTPSGPAHH